MPTPEALIRRLTFHATAAEAGEALRVLHVAEAAIHRAVEAAAASIGGEVLVLRRVDLAFAVDLDGDLAFPVAQMEAALGASLVHVLHRARPMAAAGPAVTEEAAWFPTEAAAIGDLLAAHATGRAHAWPYDSLTLWGATPGDVLRTCLGRGPVLLGDVLAATVRRIDAGALPALVGDDLAAAIVAAYTEGSGSAGEGGGRRTVAASALPADLRAAIGAEIARLPSVSPAQRDLVTLALLFAHWPPARDARIPLVDVRLLASPPPGAGAEATPAEVLADLLRGTGAADLVGRLPPDAVAALVAALRGARAGRDAALASLRERLSDAGIPTDELRRAVEGAQAKRLLSAAGGLVAWAVLFAAEGLSAEIDAAYPEPRAQRAVRWAVACALEDARIGGVDPALLLWAGEDLDALVDPGLGLAEADPEVLHRRALRLAANRGLLSAPLEVAQLGDGVTLTGDAGFCVDAVLGDDVNRAIPELVRRFVGRVGGPPAGVRVSERMRGDAVDALVEVDVPKLPEAWRVAVRAFASVARSALLTRWRAVVPDLRRWPAIVEIGHEVVVELQRADVSRIHAGAWLREHAPIGARHVRIRAK
jgi:hypothetical protein